MYNTQVIRESKLRQKRCMVQNRCSQCYCKHSNCINLNSRFFARSSLPFLLRILFVCIPSISCLFLSPSLFLLIIIWIVPSSCNRNEESSRVVLDTRISASTKKRENETEMWKYHTYILYTCPCMNVDSRNVHIRDYKRIVRH